MPEENIEVVRRIVDANRSGPPEETLDVVLSITDPAVEFRSRITAVEGAASPSSQSLAVSNTGGGTLTFTTSDDASWLAATPASGTAPATVTVAVTTLGLARGTYTGTVRVTAAGATGSPGDIPVTLTVSPPSTGLVGAWGFNEAAGTTTVTDGSGTGNNGTVSGATN